MLKFAKKIKSEISKKRLEFKKAKDNREYYLNNKELANQKKLIYALTPPSILKNIGDHAQVVAIKRWLAENFTDVPIFEVNKNETTYYIKALKKLINPDDIIFLHSGGNLGDRGLWSEKARRLIIKEFTRNQIISLPQTIYFSNTPKGQQEKEISREVYNAHPNLTVIGRDPESGRLAKELFPNTNSFCMPDFVLSLPPKAVKPKNPIPKVLLCFRLDDESILDHADRQKIADSIPYHTEFFDTTLDEEIHPDQREAVLNNVLELFSGSDVVVTDRYHGLIFTVLSQKPCVVLRTVDHKLTSAIHWFKDIPSVFFAQDLESVKTLVEEAICKDIDNIPNWNDLYFSKILQLSDIS